MPFKITVLGSNSATPINNRHPSAQILQLNERFFLIDCGEGTQMQLLRYKINWNKIEHIFISHLHGDHYLGLMGLLFTMNLNGRAKEINIYAQPDMMDIIELQLRVSSTELRYNIIFHPLQFFNSKILLDDAEIRVKTILLNHRIPTVGFHFTEKRVHRNLNLPLVESYHVPLSFYKNIKQGEDFIDDTGNVVKNSELTMEPKPAHTYAYCSDTMYDEAIIDEIRNVNLLYPEATFMSDMEKRAHETFHSTAKQAATIAKRANVERLLIGHFSSRYINLEPLLAEAQEVFPDTDLAMEGFTFVT
ncbi:MAG: ribonuclease Z [Bacteroidetes bacterium]|nr:ribonuclease Z [Bacteroidota bacterium]